MIRGVRFIAKQSFDSKTLYQMLKCLPIEKYTWHNFLAQNEVWLDRNNTQVLTESVYNGEEFIKCIDINCYVIFLKLQAYLGDYSFSNIHSYEEFLKSDCSLLVLICDCDFVDIYVKDIKDANALYEHALKNKYSDISYITDENDTRYKMDVM